MPGFDGTGPMGYGSMTGDRRGPCATDVPLEGRGARFGRGRGGGRGYRNQYYATGLTGRQRAQMGDAHDTFSAPRTDRLGRLEERIYELLARLERLDGGGTK